MWITSWIRSFFADLTAPVQDIPGRRGALGTLAVGAAALTIDLTLRWVDKALAQTPWDIAPTKITSKISTYSWYRPVNAELLSRWVISPERPKTIRFALANFLKQNGLTDTRHTTLYPYTDTQEQQVALADLIYTVNVDTFLKGLRPDNAKDILDANVIWGTRAPQNVLVGETVWDQFQIIGDKFWALIESVKVNKDAMLVIGVTWGVIVTWIIVSRLKKFLARRKKDKNSAQEISLLREQVRKASEALAHLSWIPLAGNMSWANWAWTTASHTPNVWANPTSASVWNIHSQSTQSPLQQATDWIKERLAELEAELEAATRKNTVDESTIRWLEKKIEQLDIELKKHRSNVTAAALIQRTVTQFTNLMPKFQPLLDTLSGLGKDLDKQINLVDMIIVWKEDGERLIAQWLKDCRVILEPFQNLIQSLEDQRNTFEEWSDEWNAFQLQIDTTFAWVRAAAEEIGTAEKLRDEALKDGMIVDKDKLLEALYQMIHAHGRLSTVKWFSDLSSWGWEQAEATDWEGYKTQHMNDISEWLDENKQLRDFFEVFWIDRRDTYRELTWAEKTTVNRVLKDNHPDTTTDATEKIRRGITMKYLSRGNDLLKNEDLFILYIRAYKMCYPGKEFPKSK